MQVTTAQKQADAAANAKVVFFLMLAGMLAGLMVWAAILPAEFKTVPSWRLAWALLSDPTKRSLIYSVRPDVVITFFLVPPFLSIALPAVIAAARHRRSTPTK